MVFGSKDLDALLQRLENATSRLEQVAKERASKITSNIAAAAGTAGTAPTAAAVGKGEHSDDDNSRFSNDTAVLVAFDDDVESAVDTLLETSKHIGGLIEEQAKLIKDLVDKQRVFIRVATQTKKPSMDTLREFFAPQEAVLRKITELKDANRRSEYFNHMSAIVDGIPAFGWVVMEKTPVPYIKDFIDSAKFYGNRVRKVAKDKGDDGKVEAEWIVSYESLIETLAGYVKSHFRTGITWNINGFESTEGLAALKRLSAGESADLLSPQGQQLEQPTGSSDGAPPPPPPPPPPMYTGDDSKSDAPADDNSTRSALLKDLNRGEGITGSLRKVDKSQMTHKNPSLRAGNTVPSSAGSKEVRGVMTKPAPAHKLPKMELQGKKWVIENQLDQELTVEIEDIKYAVYIYNCENCKIQIRNKLNNITIDNCKKTGVVLDAAVSESTIINSRSIELQVIDFVPGISIDKSDSVSLYLSKQSISKTTVTSAKSSAINLSFPMEKDVDGDMVEEYIELPIPEQIQTVIEDGKLVSTIYEHTA